LKLAIFDLAGTTVDDSENAVFQCFKNALNDKGIDAPLDLVNSVMGIKKLQAIKEILEQVAPEQASDELAQEIHDAFLSNINRYYSESDEVREVDGASDVFKVLKKHNIKVAFNTGFSRSTADIIANRLGWYDHGLIDASACSDEVEEGRPEPYMIQKIMKELEISDPLMVAKIGDTPSDLDEGKNAGCGLTIGVLYGTHDRSDLQDYKHDHLVSDLHDIVGLLTTNHS
jgi:phosphonatase-like hydrolase